MSLNPFKPTKGRPNLPAINGATDLKKRDGKEFAHGGNGGEAPMTCAHDRLMTDYCPECYAVHRAKEVVNKPVIDLAAIAAKIETNPLDDMAKIVHGLTYHQMVHFCFEYKTGQRFEKFDIDQANDDVRLLAAQMHKWSTLRFG